MPDFLPRRAADLLSWSANFDRLINLDPQAYHLSGEQAAAYAQAHAEFVAALRAAHDPATRGGSTINTKLGAEARLRREARMLAKIVRAALRDDLIARYDLGLCPSRPSRAQRAKPDTAPVLRVDWPRGHVVPVRLRDAASPDSTARPRDVRGALVFVCIGEHAPPWSPRETPPTPDADGPHWMLHRGASRGRLMVTFPAELPPGTKVWITAAWSNRHGAGPFASPVHAHLGEGGSRVTELGLKWAA